MEKSHWITVLAAFVVAIITLNLVGCADDRPVYMDGQTAGNAGTGGSTTGGNAGTGGTTTGGNAGTGGSSTGGTGGGADIPVYGLDNVFSFDIEQSDQYDEWSFWESKRSSLLSCVDSESCMQEAWNDSQGREFQFLGTGEYKEGFQGQMKGFCRYVENTNCGAPLVDAAGHGCTDANGYDRECVVALVFKFSASNQDLTGQLVGPIINMGPTSGDKCQPYLTCGGYEHSASIGRNGMVPMSASVNNGTTLEVNSWAQKLAVEADLADTPAFQRPRVVVKSSGHFISLNPTYKGLPK